jgi:release factor glutamine methyltransferase
MLTVLEAINLSSEYLKKKGIESPRFNAEMLLAHILNSKRLNLYLAFDKPLRDEELSGLRELLKRRSRFEPLQYILGSVEFFGLKFKVNSSALIPRPETEILVETIIEFNGNNPAEILDIGTGSGNIAVSLAKNLPQLNVTAVDISKNAINLADENIKLNGVRNVRLIQYDILNPGKDIFKEKFDIIVSNPPYVSSEEFPDLAPELKVYEPKDALTDFSDGLKFYREISRNAKYLLKPEGKIFFEMGKGLHEKIKKILEKNGFKKIQIKKDLQNIERVIFGELN